MDNWLKSILDYLLEKRGFDFSGYSPSMVQRRIWQRVAAIGCKDFSDYLLYVKENSDEIDNILDVLTINVSRFFRNTLTFELLAERILPTIIMEKLERNDKSIRVWSAGCAMGEEPYSVAIVLDDLLCREELIMNLHIFATDIDSKSLDVAVKALYPISSVENIKYRLLRKYFTQTQSGQSFQVVPEIRDKVIFSFYDILDKKHRVPPESIFGNFDLVFCRNLLIYFNTEYQETIFERLHQSLNQNGYLILGSAEAPTIKYQRHFKKVFDFSTIYKKQ
ncbi:MAG: protein-glutamate O-methyltransferase CheR [Desulfamplus sp.]|nr:protein-glutamate O-methyltransferase CheR [Desulfamplus sp.]